MSQKRSVYHPWRKRVEAGESGVKEREGQEEKKKSEEEGMRAEEEGREGKERSVTELVDG